MKQELYYYATSLNKKGLSKIPNSCLWILLTIFFIPVILSNLIWGGILLFSYILLYFLSRREANQYNRDLLRFGLFLLFLWAEFSFSTLIQYNIAISFVMAMIATLLSYEILFFIKIKRKMYSREKQNKSAWSNSITLICGVAGILAGKLIAKNQNTDFKLWIVILLCALLITYTCTFFQKYFLQKIIRQ